MSAVAVHAGETDLAAIGAVLAEPARAKVLLALGDGRALPASVLAGEAGVAASTASHHLARLLDAGLITVEARGRHRYYALAGPRVAELIEAVARVAPVQPVTSLRAGTRAHAIRYARRCYDHLAGRLGVAVTEALCERGLLDGGGSDAAGFTVTGRGAELFGELGLNLPQGTFGRACLDWTEQRPHLAGRAGAVVLAGFLERGWLVRDLRTRALRLTDSGAAGLGDRFGVRVDAAAAGQ
jgi:DNA-binding transcriptional ArsR family regulator